MLLKREQPLDHRPRRHHRRHQHVLPHRWRKRSRLFINDKVTVIEFVQRVRFLICWEDRVSVYLLFSLFTPGEQLKVQPPKEPQTPQLHSSGL